MQGGAHHVYAFLVRPVVMINSSKLSSACQETAMCRSIVYWWTIAYAQQNYQTNPCSAFCILTLHRIQPALLHFLKTMKILRYMCVRTSDTCACKILKTVTNLIAQHCCQRWKGFISRDKYCNDNEDVLENLFCCVSDCCKYTAHHTVLSP